MVEDVTKDYVKEDENTKKVNENMGENDVVFDLDIEEDFEKLEDEIKCDGLFFKPEEDVTYKIKLVSVRAIRTSPLTVRRVIFVSFGKVRIIVNECFGITVMSQILLLVLYQLPVP